MTEHRFVHHYCCCNCGEPFTRYYDDDTLRVDECPVCGYDNYEPIEISELPAGESYD